MDDPTVGDDYPFESSHIEVSGRKTPPKESSFKKTIIKGVFEPKILKYFQAVP